MKVGQAEKAAGCYSRQVGVGLSTETVTSIVQRHFCVPYILVVIGVTPLLYWTRQDRVGSFFHWSAVVCQRSFAVGPTCAILTWSERLEESCLV